MSLIITALYLQMLDSASESRFCVGKIANAVPKCDDKDGDSLLHKESLKLTLKIGRKNNLPYSATNLFYCPESSAVELVH